MIKKIISAIVLVAFTNYLIACAVNTAKKELVNDTNIKNLENITGVVLNSGEIINFSDNNAKFLNLNSVIVGINHLGLIESFSLDNIYEIRTKIYPASKNINEGIKDSSFIELLDKKNNLYQFSKGKLNYDIEKNTLTGFSTSGENISLLLKSTSSLYFQKSETISKEELLNNDTIRIKQILLNSRTAISFAGDGGLYVKSKQPVLTGITDQGKFVVIKTDDILYLNVERFDFGMSFLASIGLIAGIAGTILLVAALLKESCPFVYSYDGNKYVFDAEPLGGATSKILERSEFSKLDHLKEVDGKYKLLFTNEVYETQFINSVNMQIVDHQPDEFIYPGINNKLYRIKNPQNIYSAFDESGKDITKFISADDNFQWQSVMPKDSLESNNKIRNQLIFKFPKPKGSKSVNLIINAGTSLWGSNMIREMLLLRGNTVDNWYNEIDKGGEALSSMMSYLQSEELYQLKLYVETGDGWKNKGVVNGGGPFISETRIMKIDLNDVTGDTLKIKVNPPVGFWTFNYLAVDYNSAAEISCSKILYPAKAVNENDQNLMETIKNNDDKYYSMPDNSYKFKVEFDAPKQLQGTVRTIYINTTGYYKIHLPKDTAPNFVLLYQLKTNPGKIVQYSNHKYQEWKQLHTYKYSEVKK